MFPIFLPVELKLLDIGPGLYYNTMCAARRQSSTTAFQDDLVTIKLCVQTGLTLIMLAAWETRNTEIPHGTHYWALLTSPQRAAVFTLIIPRTSCQARAVFTVLGHTGLQVL